MDVPSWRRAVGLGAIALALALIPALVERFQAPRVAVCRVGTARCAWLRGERPPLFGARSEDLAAVPGMNPQQAAELARALADGEVAGPADLEARLGSQVAAEVLRYFRWPGHEAGRLGVVGRGVGEDGT